MNENKHEIVNFISRRPEKADDAKTTRQVDSTLFHNLEETGVYVYTGKLIYKLACVKCHDLDQFMLECQACSYLNFYLCTYFLRSE